MVIKVTIDWKRAMELRSEVGPDGFDEVVELFLEEVETVVRRMQEQPEPERFEADLHFLKGGALNLGFASFGALCQDGERRAASGRPEEVDPAAIVESYYASKAEFLAGLPAIGGQGGPPV